MEYNYGQGELSVGINIHVQLQSSIKKRISNFK